MARKKKTELVKVAQRLKDDHRQASMKIWLTRVHMDKDLTQKMVEKYGSEYAYTIMLRAMIEPTNLMKDMGKTFKNSKMAIQYFLENEISVQNIAKVIGKKVNEVETTMAEIKHNPPAVEQEQDLNIKKAEIVTKGKEQKFNTSVNAQANAKEKLIREAALKRPQELARGEIVDTFKVPPMKKPNIKITTKKQQSQQGTDEAQISYTIKDLAKQNTIEKKPNTPINKNTQLTAKAQDDYERIRKETHEKQEREKAFDKKADAVKQKPKPKTANNSKQSRLEKLRSVDHLTYQVIARQEGIISSVSPDPGDNVPSIAFGNRENPKGQPVKAGDKIKDAKELKSYYNHHMEKYVYPVMVKNFHVENMTPEQIVAVSDMIYNMGPGKWNTAYKELVKELNAYFDDNNNTKALVAAQAKVRKYVFSKNGEIKVLHVRRDMECRLLAGRISLTDPKNKHYIDIKKTSMDSLNNIVKGGITNYRNVGKISDDLYVQKVTSKKGANLDSYVKYMFAPSNKQTVIAANSQEKGKARS
ncbi:MAG: hypothetical protein IJ864_02070 [Alphaproteobacteria bacterium]|nr:hypothetical protein [Alphaproteobacteria bacterium]